MWSPFCRFPPSTAMPKSLIFNAAPLLPSVRSCCAVLGARPSCRFARPTARRCAHYGLEPAPSIHKNLPRWSGVSCRIAPLPAPQMFTPNAALFGPPSPGLPRSFIFPCFQRTACDTAGSVIRFPRLRAHFPRLGKAGLRAHRPEVDDCVPRGTSGLCVSRNCPATVTRAKLSRAPRDHFGRIEWIALSAS